MVSSQRGLAGRRGRLGLTGRNEASGIFGFSEFEAKQGTSKLRSSMAAGERIEDDRGVEILRTWVIRGRFGEKVIFQIIEKGKEISDFFFNVDFVAGWRMNSEYVLLGKR